MTQPKESYKEYRLQIIAFVIIAVVLITSVTLIVLATHTYSIRFEMDNNTLEAVKSINWTRLNEKECMPVQVTNSPCMITYPYIPYVMNYSNISFQTPDTTYGVKP